MHTVPLKPAQAPSTLIREIPSVTWVRKVILMAAEATEREDMAAGLVVVVVVVVDAELGGAHAG